MTSVEPTMIVENKYEEIDGSKAKIQSEMPDIDKLLPFIKIKELSVGFDGNRNYQNANDELVNYSMYYAFSMQFKRDFVLDACTNDIVIDRCVGCMYGMGIGDATGAPLEFINVFNNNSFFNLQHNSFTNELNKFRLQRGQWTDDASMGLCMADSLIIHKEFNGSDIRVRFWNWWNKGYCNAFSNDRHRQWKNSIGLGGNISKSLKSMLDNEQPTARYIVDHTRDDSGNGSLMRLAPIPIFFLYHKIDCALHFAKESNFTTHPGYIAAEACALMSFIIINAIHRNVNSECIISGINNISMQNNSNSGKNENQSTSGNKSEIQLFLENVTNFYLKRINSELQSISDEIERIKALKENQKSLKIFNNEPSNANPRDFREWDKLQNEMQKFKRKLYAKQLIVKLLKSNENNVSKERSWNWKSRYGQLGIHKTMRNRGNVYNGYPNNGGYFGSYCMDGLAMALHAVYHSSSIGTAIEMAVNMLGDADSTGSIAGQIAGAFYGLTHTLVSEKYMTKKRRNISNKSKEEIMVDETILLEQITHWDCYDFGLRAVLLKIFGKKNANSCGNCRP